MDPIQVLIAEDEAGVRDALADLIDSDPDMTAVGRAAGSIVRIRASLQCRDGPELRVHDNGYAVPAEIAGSLLLAPVSSRVGLGIGLYQAARHAAKSGYALTLVENRDGAVCFALAPAGA